MTNVQIENLTGEYDIDPKRTRFGFVARHAMVTKVRGHFTEFEGKAHLDLAKPERSWASVRIAAGSIVTGIAQRDRHLRSGDFLDVPGHPNITFQSTDVARVNPETIRVTGDLTMRGVSRSLAVDFVYSRAATDASDRVTIDFSGSTTINRLDWGVKWNAPVVGGVLVSENVDLEFRIGIVRTADASNSVGG